MAHEYPDQLVEVEEERLKLHPQNARKGDVDTIAQSLERFGQVKPLIVQRSTGFVVAGNHTLLAIRKLGWPKATVLVKDMDDEEALAYLVADNRASDKGAYDDGALLEVLSDVDLTGTGFTVDDLETLADRHGGNVTDVDDIGDASYTPPDDRVVRGTAPEKHKGGGEPLRDIVLMMRAVDAEAFGAQIVILQKKYGTRTVVDTVRRAVAEASL